jgi:putative ATP-dependent endonuclease of OLD family
MLLRQIRIENYRGITDLSLDLDETTVLIGDNNIGKTSIFDVVRTGLSRALLRRSAGVFEDDDRRLASSTATAQTAPPIRVRLDFAERVSGEWGADLLQTLNEIIVADDHDHRHIILTVTSTFDPATTEFMDDWAFVNTGGDRLPAKANSPASLNTFLQAVSVHYLPATRDASREFTARGQFFGAYVRNPSIPDDIRDELQQTLARVNETVLGAHSALTELRENLAKTQQIVALGAAERVDIEAVPARIADLLARTQVNITSVSGATLPLARHGAGTQSLSVIFLFESYVKTVLRKRNPDVAAILLLEEPEAHLHPNGVRALWGPLVALPGQKLLTTHSGDLLARVPLANVRRLYRRGDAVLVGKLEPGTLSAAEATKIEFHVRSSRGELLFGSVWLLVEGETEFWIYREAAAILGIDLDQLGVRIINYQWSGLEVLLKVARDFGIQWFVTADGDPAGNGYVQTASGYLAGAAAPEHIGQLAAPVMEIYLAEQGYGPIYEAHISTQKRQLVTAAAAGTPEYWPQVWKAQDDTPKPILALEVIDAMRAKGAVGVPTEISDVLVRVRHLATG